MWSLGLPPAPGYSSSQPVTVGALYFLSITFSGAVYINLLACLWFLTARLQGFSNSWLQNVNEEDMSGGWVGGVRAATAPGCGWGQRNQR